MKLAYTNKEMIKTWLRRLRERLKSFYLKLYDAAHQIKRPDWRFDREQVQIWLRSLKSKNFLENADKINLTTLLAHRKKWKAFLVLGTAAASAHLITAFLGGLLVTVKPPKVPAFTGATQAPLSKRLLANYASIYDKTFFDREGFIPDVGLGSGMLDLSSARLSTLPLELIGTIVLARDDLSVASIRDANANNIDAYQKNNPVGEHGATVYKVEHRKVYFIRSNGTLEFIQMPEEATPKISLGAKATGKGSTDGIRQDDENTYSVNAKFLHSKIENINEILTQARAIPHFENGQIVGFRIVSIQKGGVYEQLGFKENDIIKEVNDIPLNSNGQALSAFGQMKDMQEGSINIVVNSGGQDRVVTYNVRN